jgi:hypothetical protein
MKARATVIFACLLLIPGAAGAGKKDHLAPGELPVQHRNEAGTFSFRTPTDWVVETVGRHPETTEARGGGLIVRFVRREGEHGLESYHVECMLMRLRGPMEMEPRVEYEHDFVVVQLGQRAALDSAFVVRYDEPVLGHRVWRQQNLTVVGKGESLCVVGFSPLDLWRKDRGPRAALEAVLASVRWP